MMDSLTYWTIFIWAAPFERIWSERFDRLDEVLEEMKKEKEYVCFREK